MYLAFDDTDGPSGGCTTHALLRVLAALPDVAPRGLPKLVRLNPNVPWKTRGNGAIAIELVRPTGAQTRIGEWQGHELLAFPDGEALLATEFDLDKVWQTLTDLAEADAAPAVVAIDSPPGPEWYWDAVRTEVQPAAARQWLEASDAEFRHSGEGRALVGCLGALAWPGPPASFEFIAYREPAKFGLPRLVDPGPLRNTPSTFHTWDDAAGRLCCVPNTPCPVLIGLRGLEPESLMRESVEALLAGSGEPVDAWIMWATNQASGDHVTAVETILDAPMMSTISVPAIVAEAPDSREGGHVHVPMDDSHGLPFTAVAFEPTGAFRAVMRDLLPGDQVVVTGAFSDSTVRVEKIHLLVAEPRKIANPIHCDKAMKSRGAGAGYKCACGHVEESSAAKFEERPTGDFEVPVMARRHLHRPLDW